MLRYTTDRARPGLVALYDIRPGNRASQYSYNPRARTGNYNGGLGGVIESCTVCDLSESITLKVILAV